MGDYDPKKYRGNLMGAPSALLGLIVAVQVVVALYTGDLLIGRTSQKEVFRATSKPRPD